jgi:hypothetical protein
MRTYLQELTAELNSLDAKAQMMLKNMYIEQRLKQYISTAKQPYQFVLVMPQAETERKLAKLDPERVMLRLMRAERAVRVMQRTLRGIVWKVRKRKVIMLHSILRTVTLCKLREKVEVLGTSRYKRLLQIKGMVMTQRTAKLGRDRLRMGLHCLHNTVFDGFLRRAGFAIFMLKDYAPSRPLHSPESTLFQSHHLQPHKMPSSDDWFTQAPPRQFRSIESRFTDPFHAIIFQNFLHIGRTTGKYAMAERFAEFLSTAKAFYGLLGFAKGVYQ